MFLEYPFLYNPSQKKYKNIFYLVLIEYRVTVRSVGLTLQTNIPNNIDSYTSKLFKGSALVEAVIPFFEYSI
jgi:hypothetical protein